MENTEAKRNIKLIAFDLDGTTLHGFAELSERNRRAMEKANDAGILVVPATGRVRNFIPPCLTELPFIRYAITSNGYSGKQSALHRSHSNRDRARSAENF